MASTTVLDFVILDVCERYLTHNKYEGNPLAVVRVPKSCHLSQGQKQKIAREFNLSETTFLHERESVVKPDTWTVDIFTTTEELPFAGHPTIGTACLVLSDEARKESVDEGTIEAKFELKAGPVELRYDVQGCTARAAIPHNVIDTQVGAKVDHPGSHIHSKGWPRRELLAIQPQLAQACHRGEVHLEEQYPIVSIVKGMTFILVELESLEALGLVATTASSIAGYELDKGWNESFVGTYFYVQLGANADGVRLLRTRMIERTLEDPATGSAASDLAAYLSLLQKGPKQTLQYAITQGVEMGRRSDIHVDVVLTDQTEVEKVYLAGGAVRVIEGRLTI